MKISFDGSHAMILLIYFSIASSAGLSNGANAGDGTNGSPTTASPPVYCFVKISTGERLIGYDVTRIVERNTVEACQQECLIYRCTQFSFGDYDNENGTCELTTARQVSRRQDPRFDIYETTNECIEGKPKGYEQACYRRVYSGRRLRETFIRHSLPCNSLEACQHQCSIEKHFDCQGFNIRLDPARVGRGICELSSITSAYLDEAKDFTYDPEFLYYERVYSNDLANCGYINGYSGISPYVGEGGSRRGPKVIGGPYQGADSYGPWSTGYGNANHGQWAPRGYGSGYYVPNNPPRGGPGPIPQFRPTAHHRPYSYGSGGGHHSFQGQGHSHVGEKPPPWLSNFSPKQFQIDDPRPYDRQNGIPTYVIVDANAFDRRYGEPPNLNYLPTKPGKMSPKEESNNTETSPDSREEPPTMTPPNAPPDPQSLPFPTRDAALRPHVYPAKPEDLPPGPPSQPPPTHFEPPRPRTEPSPSFPSYPFPIPGREVCFQRVHPGYRLNPDSIRETYDAPTVLDCEAICTGSPFKCTGYSFRYSSSGSGTPNCLLTDFQSIARTSHLLPDRSCDVYFKMNTCLDLERTADTECFLKVSNNRKIESGKIMKSLSVSSISDCELACLNAYVFTCRSFSFRSGSGVIGDSKENCLLSDWPVSALSPQDLAISSNHDVYERGSYGHGCELDVGPNVIGPGPPFSEYPITVPGGREAWSVDETWRHYTVSGWPCKFGTECQLNPIAGFWSCEVEGGNGEQWDYCCMPRHSCGYSRGYNYPWCYVGEAGPEQWRPCSEHYYPELGNRYSNKPAQNSNLHPEDSFGPPRDAGPWNLGSLESLGTPSYWPISYLYAEPPPNETYIWDEDLHHSHHHHSEHEDHLDDGPSIRFKPCCHKFPYPKAIVQKLDLTNESKATDPEEQILSERQEFPRKIGYRDAVHATNQDLGFSGENKIKEKENLEDEISNMVPEEEEAKKNATKVEKKETQQNTKLNKSKQVIKTVEKIIEESTRVKQEKDNHQTVTDL